ncbi:hypothetical protein Tsubulata_018129 [Turnera subulata]|uniref:SPX domain-containing protein n=1 Tax=Turnera subulata TaxID=218843 RepID=A0A9Q0FZR8_9ROSI|nr:hypothetical protein Tsubulata_018129 [Turnera subulata]
MKFWKSLSLLIEDTLPEWRDKFLSYKDLKKQLKLIYPKEGDKPPSKRPRLDPPEGEVAEEVIDFVRILEDEMEKLNSFIVEKEEDFVIKWKELQEKVGRAKEYSTQELMEVGREIVDFHGEMVLLENYSAFNYTGLVKILKKYDKRSGALVRLPFIQKVMQQPFFTTHVLNQLVKECEMMIDRFFNRNQPTSVLPEASTHGIEGRHLDISTQDMEGTLRVTEELEAENIESMYMKTRLALRVLEEVRSKSSTVNMFSLPPLQSNEVEQDWKKATVLEQVAK